MRLLCGIVLSVCVLLPSATAQDYQLKYPAGLKKMRIPADNPLTQAKIDLGRQLFFDKRLSLKNDISCATCHDPKKGWSNNAAVATGHKGLKGGRSAPTVINAGYSYFQFWDGRARQLEGQALGPIENPIEMALPIDDAVKKLQAIEGYRSQFKSVFGTEVTADGIAKAIASFERTVLSGDAPYDRFKAGDKKALSPAAERGRKLFFGKANCSACHAGSYFSDGAFHNIGVGMDQEKPDKGRYVVTKLQGDLGSFKTPTLREIKHTAPYMHDGSLKTLEDVVDFYDKGGIKNPQLDEELFPLELSKQQKSDLVTFLKQGLSSPRYPTVDPPTLPK